MVENISVYGMYIRTEENRLADICSQEIKLICSKTETSNNKHYSFTDKPDSLPDKIWLVEKVLVH